MRLSRIIEYLTDKYKLILYKAYIQLHLDYCNSICGNKTVYNKNKIHRLQKRACKLILGINYTDFESTLQNLNIIKFKDRFTFNKAIAMFKIAYDDSQKYLRDMFKMKEQVNANNTITLRSVTNMNLWIPQIKLEIYKNSLSYSGL